MSNSTSTTDAPAAAAARPTAVFTAEYAQESVRIASPASRGTAASTVVMAEVALVTGTQSVASAPIISAALRTAAARAGTATSCTIGFHRVSLTLVKTMAQASPVGYEARHNCRASTALLHMCAAQATVNVLRQAGRWFRCSILHLLLVGTQIEAQRVDAAAGEGRTSMKWDGLASRAARHRSAACCAAFSVAP